MQYDPKIGLFGNIKRLFDERNRINEDVVENKAQAELEIIEAEANKVEAVIDEYLAIIGEEEFYV